MTSSSSTPDQKDKSGSVTQIVVAIIGLISAVAVAWISNRAGVSAGVEQAQATAIEQQATAIAAVPAVTVVTAVTQIAVTQVVASNGSIVQDPSQTPSTQAISIPIGTELMAGANITTQVVKITVVKAEIIGKRVRWYLSFNNTGSINVRLTVDRKSSYISANDGTSYALINDISNLGANGAFAQSLQPNRKFDYWFETELPDSQSTDFIVGLVGDNTFGNDLNIPSSIGIKLEQPLPNIQ